MKTPFLSRSFRLILLTCALILLFVVLSAAQAADVSVAVDGNTVRQTMDGFGCTQRVFDDPHLFNNFDSSTGRAATVLTAAQQDEVLDKLYVDLGLTRVRPATGDGPIEPVNDNSDPNVTDLTKFSFAWKLNDAHFDLVKRNKVRGATTWFLSPIILESWFTESNPEEYVEWAMAIIRRWRDQGLEMPYYSIVNEPGYSRSGVWSGAWIRDVIKLLGPKLRAEGFSTKIVVPDDLDPSQAYNRLQVILADAQARQYVGALAYHLYGGSNADKLNIKQLSLQYGIPIWMTEWAIDASGWANTLHDHISLYNVSALDFMWGFFGQWDGGSMYVKLLNDGAQYQGYQLNRTYYITGQYSRFVKPGFQRIEASSSSSSVKVTAYRKGTDLVLVALNTGASDTSVQVNLSGVSGVAQLQVVRTGWNSAENWAALPPVTVSNSSFLAALAPGSVTTFYAGGTPSAPIIVTQPASQTVTEGQAAAFSVSATGTAPLAYQWRKNAVNIAGATAAAYTTPPATAADNGALFSVAVSNSTGRVTSGDAALTVQPAPAAWETMASPGTGFLAGSGTTLHFASGNGTVVYRRSTNEGASWSGSVTIGAGSLYLEDPLIADGSNVYLAYVRDVRSVSDWLGPRPLGNIYLRVSNDDGLTWGPERQIAASQSMLRLSFAASGQRVYATWMDYRSGVWDVYFRRSIDGGTTWLPEVRLVAGTTAMGAERPQIACAGSTVHVAWMDGRDGKPPVLIEDLTVALPQSTEIYYKSSLDEGATWGPDLRLTNHPTDYSGRPDIAATPEGTVIVSYDHALDGGKLEEFIVRSPNGGTSWVAPQRMSFADNDSTHSYLVASNGLVHLAWGDERPSQNGVYYRQSSDRGGSWDIEEFVGPASGKTAPFTAATSSYFHATWAGNYRRRALSVPSPVVTEQPAGQTVAVGQAATFSVTATGAQPLSYQWQKNGVNLVFGTASSYSTPATVLADSGSTFRVIVSNSAGSVTSNDALLTVNAAPTAPAITSQPANQTVAIGETATFSVTAIGAAPLSYQWRKDAVDIAGATAASYTTPPVAAADNGALFSVAVSNSAGSATSNNAALSVNSGLLGHWKFDETSGLSAADSSGNNRTGTLVNGPLWTGGRAKGALSFDGANDYVAVADFNPPASLTLAAWIFPGNKAGVDSIILNKHNSEYDFRLGATGQLSGSAGGTGLSDPSFNYYDLANRDKWYHVAYTFDTVSRTHQLYRDGLLVASGANTAAISNQGTQLWIGRHSQYNFGTFLGKLDEVLIYGRALSGQEIADLAAVGGNTAPAISGIPDQATAAGVSTGAIPFTVGDAETAAGSLVLSAASDNSALAPAGNVVFGGSGADRTVAVTPVAGQSGTATITVTVTDSGGLTASDAFVLTVSAANTAPVANSQSVALAEDTAVALTLGGSDAEGDPLAFIVLANPSRGTLSGAGANRTYTPAADFNGTDSFTFKVNDGQLDSNSATVSIVANPVNDAPVLVSGPAASPNPAMAGETVAFSVAGSDIDGDALTYSWTFGDGSAGAGAAPSHAYAAPGSYTATVTVGDGQGGSFSASVGVTVKTGIDLGLGLLGYWKLDEALGNTSADSSGNGRNGAWKNGPLADSNAAPAAFSNPKSLAFDGNNDYVTVADFPAPGSLTMSAWIYPAATDSAVDRIILNKHNTEYDFRISAGTGELAASAGGAGLKYSGFDFSAVGNRGHWYHVAYSFDKAAASQRLYVNGVLVASGSKSVPIADTPNALWIGRHSQYNFGTFRGNIDEVHLYGRALSSDEIAALAAGAETTLSTPLQAVSTEAQPLAIKRLRLQRNFSMAGEDGLRLLSSLAVAKDFAPGGIHMTVAVGGAEWVLRLDEKGRARANGVNAALKVGRKIGADGMKTAQLIFRATRQDFAEAWGAEGMTAGASSESVPIKVEVLLLDCAYAGQTILRYTQSKDRGLAR